MTAPLRLSGDELQDVLRGTGTVPPSRVAAELVQARAELSAAEAELSGLREALRGHHADDGLARDLAAKAGAVREHCARAVESELEKAVAARDRLWAGRLRALAEKIRTGAA